MSWGLFLCKLCYFVEKWERNVFQVKFNLCLTTDKKLVCHIPKILEDLNFIVVLQTDIYPKNERSEKFLEGDCLQKNL
jgi:hypothetical protein